uniref:Uncharacterized protein n=1 Tax=Oryza glumipatula TaxID=40148 RepID=A0A0D9ZA12_9ORYZ
MELPLNLRGRDGDGGSGGRNDGDDHRLPPRARLLSERSVSHFAYHQGLAASTLLVASLAARGWDLRRHMAVGTPAFALLFAASLAGVANGDIPSLAADPAAAASPRSPPTSLLASLSSLCRRPSPSWPSGASPGTPPRGRRPPPSNLRPAAAQRRSPASPRHPALPGRHDHGGGAASAGELALLGPAGEALITVRRRRVEAASRPARIGACRSADEDATAGEGVDWEGEPLGFEVSTTPIPELPDPETTTSRPPPVSSPRRRVDDGTALLTAASNRLHGHVGVHDGLLFHRRRRLRRVEPATPPAASPSGARPPPV